MMTRSSLIALVVLASLVLAVWVIAGNQPQVEVKAAPVFKMRAGSGEIPPGSAEIVSAGRKAAMRTAAGQTIGLAALVDRMVDDVNGATFSGPLEIAVRGGVSFYVPNGAEMRLSQRPDEGVQMQAMLGSVFARNVRTTLRVDAPGSMVASKDGRFADLRGRAEAGLAGQTVTVEGEGAGRAGLPHDLVEPAPTDVPPVTNAVSPSQAAR
ncbi:MAG: hypothetical protein U1E76_19825 [Planctomycetota bacterium]